MDRPIFILTESWMQPVLIPRGPMMEILSYGGPAKERDGP
jgi:hypothetical protein